jgi:hypothetical protein
MLLLCYNGVACLPEIKRKALTAQVTHVARDYMATRLIAMTESNSKGMVYVLTQAQATAQAWAQNQVSAKAHCHQRGKEEGSGLWRLKEELRQETQGCKGLCNMLWSR